MEREPDTDNVVYIDEYPHLIARCEARLILRGVQRTLSPVAVILEFPEFTPPDGAA